MFETGKAIREAKIKQIRDEGIEEGLEEGRKEGRKEAIELVRTVLKESGLSLPPEAAARLYDDKR